MQTRCMATHMRVAIGYALRDTQGHSAPATAYIPISLSLGLFSRAGVKLRIPCVYGFTVEDTENAYLPYSYALHYFTPRVTAVQLFIRLYTPGHTNWVVRYGVWY